MPAGPRSCIASSPRSRCQCAQSSFATDASVPATPPDCNVRSACARMTSSRTYERVSRSRITGSSIDAVVARELDERVEFAPEADLLAERGDPALERERAHRDAPAVADLADHEVGGGAGVVEEDLVELRGAGELHDRAHLDAGLLHRHEQVGEPAVTLGAGIGACEHEAPVGDVRERRPDLLPGDRPLVAVDGSRVVATAARSEPAPGSE